MREMNSERDRNAAEVLRQRTASLQTRFDKGLHQSDAGITSLSKRWRWPSIQPDASQAVTGAIEYTEANTDLTWITALRSHGVSPKEIIDVFDTRERLAKKEAPSTREAPAEQNLHNQDIEAILAPGTTEQELYARDGDSQGKCAAAVDKIRSVYAQLQGTGLSGEQHALIDELVATYGTLSEIRTDNLWIQVGHLDPSTANEKLLRTWDSKAALREDFDRNWQPIKPEEKLD